MSVKRFMNWCLASHGHEMMETVCGPYVLRKDYEALQAACMFAMQELRNRDCGGSVSNAISALAAALEATSGSKS